MTKLYASDFFAWTQEQAEALRAAARTGSNQALDWESIAEEIEGLGISQRSALGSQIRRIMHHLLKLQYSRAHEPRSGWQASIVDAQAEIDALLELSPSLAREIDNEIARQQKRAIRLALKELEIYRELDPAIAAAIRATSYTRDQVLGDWFPSDQPRSGEQG
jgi:Domain of unknown function DUF29